MHGLPACAILWLFRFQEKWISREVDGAVSGEATNLDFARISVNVAFGRNCYLSYNFGDHAAKSHSAHFVRVCIRHDLFDFGGKHNGRQACMG
jgi:hypothetical protein